MKTETSSAGRKPVWLLDVDGVLNCNTPLVSWGVSKIGSVRDDFDVSWQIKWAPPLIDRLRAGILSGLVEVVWSTTWVDHVHALEKLWDLPPLRKAFKDLPTQYTGDYKLAAAEGVLGAGRRLIWTDDTEVPDEGDPLFAELHAKGECLLIAPNQRLGLTPEHMDQIARFC